MEDLNLIDSEAVEIRERYLTDIQLRLGTYRSARDTYETISEMRSHLNAMAQAHSDLGIEPLEGMAQAIRHFGSAEAVATSLLKNYRTPAHRLKALNDTIWSCGVLGALSIVGYLFAHDPNQQREFSAWEIYALLGAFAGLCLGCIAFLIPTSKWRFAIVAAVAGSLGAFGIAGFPSVGPIEFGFMLFLAFGCAWMAQLNRDAIGVSPAKRAASRLLAR